MLDKKFHVQICEMLEQIKNNTAVAERRVWEMGSNGI
jgi:hypothetical protein